MPLPHHIVHSIAHANHAVCHYPIGVILSIAQGWQVQRSLPWVTMQARRLPPWGLYFFSSHIITTCGERMISHMQIDFKKYNADGIGSRSATLPGVDFAALNQPRAIKSTTPMVLVHVHCFHQPTNKQNHPHAIHPNETVGAVPACPPERPHSGVSIRK